MSSRDPNFESLLALARRAADIYFPAAELGRLFSYDDHHGSITMSPSEVLLPSPQFGLAPADTKRWAVTMAQNVVDGVFGDDALERHVHRRQSMRCNCGRKRKGRVIHIRRNRGERLLVASISFHVPTSTTEPIAIQSIARSTHPSVSPAEVTAAVWALKQYVHALAPSTVPAGDPERTTRLLHNVPANSHSPTLHTYLRAIGFVRAKSKYAPPNTVSYRQESG